MADVFLSYARKDEQLARMVEAKLKEEGHFVWWDDRLNPTQAFDALIEKQLDAAAAVVVLWTPRSVSSEWVRNEANFAIRKITPAIMEQCQLPLAFHRIQAARLEGWNGDRGHPEWRKLCEWIDLLSAAGNAGDSRPPVRVPPTPVPPAERPRPPDPPAPDRTVGDAEPAGESVRIRIAIVAALMVVVLAGFAAFLVVGQTGHRACSGKFPDARSIPGTKTGPVVATADCLDTAYVTFRDCEDCPQLVTIPPGTFSMGASSAEGGESDERPIRPVTIKRPFAIGRFEVTWGQWNICVRNGACEVPGNPSDDRTVALPVHDLSWDQIQAYLQWLGKVTGESYRLPSEAEWEYAAWLGAPNRLRYVNGDSPTDACRSANVFDRTARAQQVRDTTSFFACDDGIAYRAPVGSYRPGPSGLYDMIGNVVEAVADCYRNSYEGAPGFGEARVFDDCKNRVMRGGSYLSTPNEARVTFRDDTFPSAPQRALGFRVVRELR